MIGNEVEGVGLEEARKKTLAASDALVEIASLTKRCPSFTGYDRQIILYVSS